VLSKPALGRTAGKENALVRLYRETRAELRKVAWPTRQEVVNLTAVVIALSAAVGLYLYIVDSLLEFGYRLLVNLR
jgi:preprotein translocase subunit SecE